MLGLAYGTGFHLAHDDAEFTVGIRGDLIEPLVADLKGRILEHGHKLLVQRLNDLILLLFGRVGIPDHHHSQIFVILLHDPVGNNLRDVIDDTGNIAPLGHRSVPVVDDIIHAALDAPCEAEPAAHIAVQLIIGCVVDQRKLCLVQGSDDCHALKGRSGQILVIDIDYEEVAVDLIVFFAGDADDTGAGLSHSVGALDGSSSISPKGV